MRHPTPYPADAFANLSSVVSDGRYRRFEDQALIPSAVSRIAGSLTSSDFRFVTVAASTITALPEPLGGITPEAHSPIYGVSIVRSDFGDSSRPHFNRDQVLLFQDGRGQHWQLHRKDLPDHFRELSTSSGLTAALEAYGALPSSGTITSIL